jgi:hypothetical protein
VPKIGVLSQRRTRRLYVDADLDTLAIALCVRTDDVLKNAPEQLPWRPPVGIAPKISDAEVVTLAVMRALLGFTSEARRLRYAARHLSHLSPYLPQPGYNKRLRGRSTSCTRPTSAARLLSTRRPSGSPRPTRPSPPTPCRSSTG